MLEWRIFNEDFEEDYRGWSNNLAKPYSSSTIGAQLSIMKTWLSDAEGKGFVTNKAFHKWQTKSRHDDEESDAIYLNEEEINKIYNLDLQSEEVKQKVAKNIDIKKLDEIRDLFIIGCKTGLRFSDWGLNLRHAIVVEGDIMKVFNQKTQKDVLIPLTPTLNEIIAKYGGFDKLPIPPIESTAIHRIQVLGKLAGLDDNIAINIKRGNSTIPKTVKKYEMIVTHTGRRSFVTNLIAKGATFSEIATATGHTEAYLIKRYNKLEKTEMSRKLQKYIS